MKVVSTRPAMCAGHKVTFATALISGVAVLLATILGSGFGAVATASAGTLTTSSSWSATSDAAVRTAWLQAYQLDADTSLDPSMDARARLSQALIVSVPSAQARLHAALRLKLAAQVEARRVAAKAAAAKRKAIAAAKAKAARAKAAKAKLMRGPWKKAKVSWYGPGFYGHTMAGGGKLKRTSMIVAHRTLKFGTRVLIEYKGRTCIAVVKDRGPFVSGRTFDLGPGTAKTLKFGGVGKIRYRIIKK